MHEPRSYCNKYYYFTDDCPGNPGPIRYLKFTSPGACISPRYIDVTCALTAMVPATYPNPPVVSTSPSGPGKPHPVTVDQVDPEGARQDSKSDSDAEELDRELL
jgi:hypothetical protein